MEPTIVFDSHVKMETMVDNFSNRFTKGARALPSQLHTVVFAIKKLRMNELRDILDDISNPYSLNYGKHLTREEVTQLTVNREGSDSLLYFLGNFTAVDGNVKIVTKTPNMDYITARASVELWERLFNAELFQFYIKSEQHAKGLSINSFQLPYCINFLSTIRFTPSLQRVFPPR